MVFDIDPTKCRVVDLSAEIVAPGTEDRPFRVTRGFLADRAFKHDIETHSHVGCHIESPAHFFEDGRELGSYPLDAFYGRAVVLEFTGVDGEPVDAPAFEDGLGDVIRDGDIVVCRNSAFDWRQVAEDDPNRLPYLCPEGARWLVARKVKLLVIDAHTGIRIAGDPEMSRENHAILMAPGVEMPILEGADGVADLRRREFFFMALPLKVRGVDSAWARAIAIEER